jgi:hypothetical protein
MKNKNIILYCIAALLAISLFFAIGFYLRNKLYIGLFWICYTVLPLIIIGILLKKPNLILSQLIIIMIPDLLWIADFIGIVLTGNSFLGVSKYFFEPGSLFKKILTLQHFYLVPLSILALGILKVDKIRLKLLLISFAELIGFFILGFILPAQYGINCLPTSATCTSFVFPKIIPYPLIWVIAEFSFVLISFLIIYYLPFIKKKRRN